MSCPKLARVAGQGVEGPVVIAIMDGVGIGKRDDGDAVAKACTPNLDRYANEALTTRLAAHGRAVGMPTDEDMGNSEVGHNALGAGRVFEQGAKRVGAAIDSGRLFSGATWRELVARCVRNDTALHFIGVLSDGNVHAHIDHLLALIAGADAEGVRQVYIHPLLDGRDVPKTSAHIYLEQLEAALGPIDGKADRRYRIASGGGRMKTTMDRYEADWSIVERGWKTHVLGDTRPFTSALEALQTLRGETPGISDQDLGSFVIVEDGEPVGPIRDGDSVIAFHFRGDRMLELTRAFEDDNFDKFDRVRRPDVLFAGMMEYDGDTKRPKKFLVEPPEITCTLGELLCDAGVGQLACSETQKFGHVTYFWNGNRSGAFDDALENYIEIPSYKPPFDGRPEMRAPEIADTVAKELASGTFGLARLNFANGDMVGHTGNMEATVAAVEAVDAELLRLERAVVGAGGALIITADHGNA
ncbi:MAG: 2,3-bisphosphoglycerate-independent phosphoglycerate mutase, partial [Myxococcota bacterium]